MVQVIPSHSTGCASLERYHRLLLDVWREACQHIEIAEALDRIGPLVARKLPHDTLLLRRIDTERSTVDTVAATRVDGQRFTSPARTQLSADEVALLLAWCRRQQVLRSAVIRLPAEGRLAIPDRVGGEIIVAPLVTAAEVHGVAIFTADRSRSFDDDHVELARILSEPLNVALENDRRVHELIALREKAEADNRSLLSRLGRSDISDAIVGAETGLRAVMDRVDLVARADVPVLILGETGSGKEVVARSIHNKSERVNGPFMRVNCGAIPPDLVDSELFGHERGSFTGASTQRKGWFERADRGTLFLDECGELPLSVQVRLLRVLQDGELERVGGEAPIRVDVRIVAATNRNLETMIARGEFREDLWYRLAVFPIQLPPLRDRRHDIPALATHFALRASKRFGLPACVPTPEDLGLLVGYSWPGNVRELGAVIERAAILGDGKRLDVAAALGAAPPRVLRSPEPSPLPFAAMAPVDVPVDNSVSLQAAMARHIEQALVRCRGRIEGPHGAAKLLGINPHTLRARMRKLGIDWARYRAIPD